MNAKVILGVGLVLSCAVVGLFSLGGSTVSSVAFAEVPKASARVEVYGILDKSSIRPIRGHNLVAFDLVEEKTGARLPVLYDNPGAGLPANFPAASHARAAGQYDPSSRQFHANRVLTKCPSKYEEKNLDVATKAAVDRWKAETASTGVPSGT